MRRAAVGTIAVHGLVAIALVAIGRNDESSLPHPRPIEITEITDLVNLADFAPGDPPAPPSSAATGGGAAGGPSSTLAPAITTPAPRRDVTRVVTSPATTNAPDDVASILGPAASGDAETKSDSISPQGDGSGGGSGGGTGRGIGLGVGPIIGTHAQRVDAPTPPPPPKLSKARPPRLIFPMRSRDIEPSDEASKLFVASVLVDEHGDVAGARLVEMRHTPADAVAESLIFHFRYEPALDDDGHPIRARIDQPFLVE